MSVELSNPKIIKHVPRSESEADVRHWSKMDSRTPVSTRKAMPSSEEPTCPAAHNAALFSSPVTRSFLTRTMQSRNAALSRSGLNKTNKQKNQHQTRVPLRMANPMGVLASSPKRCGGKLTTPPSRDESVCCLYESEKMASAMRCSMSRA